MAVSEQLPHDEELRTLYRRLPADEPRADIDANILAAARAESRQHRRSVVLRRLRWTLPLAAAAGVILTLSLTRLEHHRDALDVLGETDSQNATQKNKDAQPENESGGA